MDAVYNGIFPKEQTAEGKVSFLKKKIEKIIGEEGIIHLSFREEKKEQNALLEGIFDIIYQDKKHKVRFGTAGINEGDNGYHIEIKLGGKNGA